MPKEGSSGKGSGINRFGLNLNKNDIKQYEPPGLQPMVSPSYESVSMWSILPSYQMYESTFSKNIRPTEDEEDLAHPPLYEAVSPGPSPAAAPPSQDYFNIQVPSNMTELPNRCENSILGNIHKIKHLSDARPAEPSNLKIEIHVISKNEEVDVSEWEYQQGDMVKGYVLVENVSKERIRFDMFSIVLEGKISVMGDVADSKKPVIFFKFLNMYDFNASWSPARVDQKDGQDSDGTWLSLPSEKFFSPGVVYKRFFSFTLPDKLLDCSCETHNLTRHCQVLPSIGLARDQFMQERRKLRLRNAKEESSLLPIKSNTSSPQKKSTAKNHTNERLKDLSFSDTAISYSVEARVIGRASQYKSLKPPSPQPDEFIVVENSSCFFRVIPFDIFDEVEIEDLEADAKLRYRNIVERINEKISLGKQLVDNCSVSDSLARKLSIAKRNQLYNGGGTQTLTPIPSPDSFIMITPLKRKQTITSSAKVMGLFELSTPKQDFTVKYYPAKKFSIRGPSCASRGNSTLDTKVILPIDLLYTPSLDCKNNKPPEIKSIHMELIVFTYRSRKYPIPIEITPDLIFNNKSPNNDGFEFNVCQPFQKYMDDITELTKKLGCEVLDIDSQLVMDIKALANLSCKYHHLKLDNIQVRTEKGIDYWKTEGKRFSKTINILADLKDLLSKEIGGSNDSLHKEFYSLVPSFQSCILGRFYFFNVIIKFNNYEQVCLKIPIEIKLT